MKQLGVSVNSPAVGSAVMNQLLLKMMPVWIREVL